jgi:hypothetical protein
MGVIAGYGAVHIFPPLTSFTILKAAAANPTVAITAQKSGTLRSKSTAAATHRPTMKTHVDVVPPGEPTSTPVEPSTFSFRYSRHYGARFSSLPGHAMVRRNALSSSASTSCDNP